MIKLKKNEEIKQIRKANKIIAEVFEELSGQIKAGMTTEEINQIVDEGIRSRNAVPSFKDYSPGRGYPPFPGSACVSVNDEVIHGIPSDKNVLKEGDMVKVDIGTNYQGFFGDSARTYLIGEVSPEKKKLSEDTRNALYEAINVAKEGAYLNEIGKAIQFYLNRNGQYGIVRDFCGHGVGFAVHEEPQILHYHQPKIKGPKLKNGMVLAIEPMITLGTHKVGILEDRWTVVTEDGSPAAHWEHSIVISGKKAEILSEL